MNMSTYNYHLELYQMRAKRLRRLALLFPTLLCIAFINFYTHQFEYKQYYNSLPLVLYNFSQEYKEALVDWCEIENGSDANKQFSFIKKVTESRFIIVFQNSQVSTRSIIWDKIPLLVPYLDVHVPKLRRRNTLFSWELPTPIFLFATVLAPTALLLLIVINVRGLLRMRRLAPSKVNTGDDVKLIMRSIFFSRISIKNKEFPHLQATALGALFFLCTSISSLVFLQAPLFAFRQVTGILYAGSSMVSNVFIGPEMTNKLSNDFIAFYLAMIVINFVLCAIIGRDFTRLNKD